VDLRLHAGEHAFLRDAGLVAKIHRVAATMRVEHLLARVEELHRPPGLQGEKGDAELEVERLALAAEASPHRRLDDAHPVSRDAQHLGQVAVQVVRHLGRRVDGDHPVHLGDADRAVRFDRHVSRACIVEVLLEDDVARGERAFDVAKGERHLLRDVSLLREGIHLVRVVLVGERVLDREHRRQNLVIDLDVAQRLGRRPLVDGGDAGDRVADVGDLVEGQRVFVLGPRDDAVGHGQVAPGARRLDARQRERLRQVDLADARVRMGRAQDLGVKHAGKDEVVGVDRLAGHLPSAVDLPVSLADDREAGLGPGGRTDVGGRAQRPSSTNRSPAFKQASKIFV
jgi:hypothetical protein